ncbi:glutamate 5-kinase [Deferribacter desulfuricans SSM1]|uniref:Glutamate 5-kinase n=1 Tax=Deferribacter desulfuricans (strain DSM 14783 / JCM 11476 / NBRC 101012 / SSM1) TaxID=639282 RepID=D3PE21_DEFDS|nr:glutamate 5-kinase [Deferribacter desulfuricans]BAI80844.1 glutamate 5-kinase [Deferribacter desulfuricans SSM1]
MRKLPDIKTLVIKIGSNLLTNNSRYIDKEYIRTLAKTIHKIKKDIKNILIVSSGAIAAGMQQLGIGTKPKDIALRQACAAIGQPKLIQIYEDAFDEYNIKVAQILITKDDFANRRRYLNAKYTIRELFKHSVVPIVNENDTVVVEELKFVDSFGDNDNLSALIAGLIGAELLLILSDVDGFFSKDPTKHKDAVLINEIKYFDSKLLSMAGDSISNVGTGGMKSKILAAKKALNAGCYVGIINGKDPDNIVKFLNGEEIGTFFSHLEDPLKKRKLWIAYATIPKGEIVVDNGARNALINKYTSLLPSGIVDVKGRFSVGDIVKIVDINGIELGRGKVRYNHQEIEKIKGKKTTEIMKILGYKFSDEVIHRDDFVLSDFLEG